MLYMQTSTPEELHNQLERMFRQAAAMTEGSETDADLARRMLNQLAIGIESTRARPRASDAPAQTPSDGQYCSARR
ncbi:MAG: hypothetical protein C0483_04185 [Pirellula sp.]|nr:hypothetical protein [Pirellula sp.]